MEGSFAWHSHRELSREWRPIHATPARSIPPMDASGEMMLRELGAFANPESLADSRQTKYDLQSSDLLRYQWGMDPSASGRVGRMILDGGSNEVRA
jgi:hypothetical protein